MLLTDLPYKYRTKLCKNIIVKEKNYPMFLTTTFPTHSRKQIPVSESEVPFTVPVMKRVNAHAWIKEVDLTQEEGR